MSAMNLCGNCERHVYVDEPACPFCGSNDARRTPESRARKGRLSRSAIHAARAALVAGAVAGCSEAHVPEDTGDAGRDTAVVDSAAPDTAVADTAVADVSDDNPDADTPIYGGVFPDPRKRAVV